MTKQNLKDIYSQLFVWEDWKTNYNNFVPKFITEASTGNDWSKWDPVVFHEFFHRSADQCVSSLRQGYFTKSEQEKIKSNWKELAPLFQKIALNQNVLNLNEYLEIKTTIRKHTKLDRRAATNRLIAALQPELLCTVVNEGKIGTLFTLLNNHVANFESEWKNNWFENSYQILQFFKKELNQNSGFEILTLPWQVYEEYNPNTIVKSNDMSEIESDLYEYINLLQYKKQIILQGPPGTGKTRLAEEIAWKLICSNNEIRIEDFKEIISKGGIINSIEVEYVKDNNIHIRRNDRERYSFTLSDLYNVYTSGFWLSEKFVDYPLYAQRLLVKAVAAQALDEIPAKQLKTVQFHPSYSYEDFVRGIAAKPNEEGEGISYKAENKLLGDFAELALSNYLSSKGEQQSHSFFQSKLDNLLESIRVKIEEGKEYLFSDKSTARIIAIKEDGLLYNFPSREEIKYKVLFSDLEKVFNVRNQIEKPIDLRDIENTAGLVMKGKYPYYHMLLKQLEAIEEDSERIEKQDLKNYVLVIDEINRANLSSVLGELIYAFEYRGHEVETMYKVNGSNKLILPPNLYIIGTMNTADRSVGHIDYAIRRRFAFIDVLPRDLSGEIDGQFSSDLFKKVTDLFTTDDYKSRSIYISDEFEPKQVALGHSYFIDQSKEGGNIETRWNYEIKPILLEYIRDGVLKDTAVKKIEEIEKTFQWES